MTEETLIGYVMRYGGMCRDCADMDGVCQSGMPCDTDQRRAVVRHTISALGYGIKHGFIANPFHNNIGEAMTNTVPQTFDEIVENCLRIWFFNYDETKDNSAYRVAMREIVNFVSSSALAAAEERGRSEERERLREMDCVWAETLTHEMRERMISEMRERIIYDMNGLIEFLAENPDNIYHLDADKVQLLRAAITEEPTS